MKHYVRFVFERVGGGNVYEVKASSTVVLLNGSLLHVRVSQT